MQQVLEHPAFVADPFAALQEHLSNTIAAMNDKAAAAAERQGGGGGGGGGGGAAGRRNRRELFTPGRSCITTVRKMRRMQCSAREDVGQARACRRVRAAAPPRQLTSTSSHGRVLVMQPNSAHELLVVGKRFENTSDRPTPAPLERHTRTLMNTTNIIRGARPRGLPSLHLLSPGALALSSPAPRSSAQCISSRGRLRELRRAGVDGAIGDVSSLGGLRRSWRDWCPVRGLL